MTVRANEYSNHEPIYMAQPVASAPGAVPNKPHCGQGTQEPMAQMPEHHHLH